MMACAEARAGGLQGGRRMAGVGIASIPRSTAVVAVLLGSDNGHWANTAARFGPRPRWELTAQKARRPTAGKDLLNPAVRVCAGFACELRSCSATDTRSEADRGGPHR